MNLNQFLSFLDNNLNGFIITLGVIVGVILVVLAVMIKSRFKDLKHQLLIADDGRNDVLETRRLAKLSVVNEKRNEFGILASWYNFASQLISIFPLLGILGTVAGLIINTQAGSIPGLDALGFALSSTLYGLFASISLKIIDTVLTNFLIQPIESAFDNYDINYVLHELKEGRISEEAAASILHNQHRNADFKSSEHLNAENDE